MDKQERSRKKQKNLPRKKQGKQSRPAAKGRDSQQVVAKWLPNEEAWELLHPRCALQRSDDMEEVRTILDAGEFEVAFDELRWLLGGCPDFIDAHVTLGEIALKEDDIKLARGHFGHAYNLGLKSLKRASSSGPLPYRLKANHGFHEAGKGLLWCLLKLGKKEMAHDVFRELGKLDPKDPLGVKELWNQFEQKGNPGPCSLPLVTLDELSVPNKLSVPTKNSEGDRTD